MGNWIKKTFKKYSYVFNLVLIVAALAFAGVAIYQCVQIKNYYSVRQTELTQIKESLLSLEEYVDEHPPTEENPAGVQIEIAYPSTIDDLDEISDVISIVQEDNAQALSTINSYLVIFSITITVVTIIIPILNYAFIQKDQIKRLDKQYKKSKEKFHKELEGLKKSSDAEIERMKKSIIQSIGVSFNVLSSAGRTNSGIGVNSIEPISDSSEDRATAFALNAEICLLTRQYSLALHKISKAIELGPDNAKYYNDRGVTLHVMKRYGEALRDKNKAIELEPDNARYYDSRGATLHELKRYDEALRDENKAIKLEPTNAKYYDERGVTLHAMKHYDEALRDENKAIELEPDNARYYNNRGGTLHEMKRYDEALRDKNKAIDLEPDNARYYNSRGATLYRLKHYEEALRDTNKAIELEPDNAEYYCNRGATLHEMGRYNEALKDKTKAIELEPDNARYYDSRGTTLLEMKRYDEALEDANKAIELEPDNARHYYSRGVTLHAMKRFDEALRDSNKAIDLEPDNAGFYDDRAITLWRLKRYKEALEDSTKAVNLEPRNSEYSASLAYSLYLNKKYLDALQCLKEMENYRNSVIALRAFALSKLKMALQTGKDITEEMRGEILNSLERAILEFNENNVYSYLDKAEALLLLKEPDEAHKSLNKALELEGAEHETYFLLAWCYREKRDDEKAKGKDTRAKVFDDQAAEYNRTAMEMGYIPEPDDDSKPDDEK